MGAARAAAADPGPVLGDRSPLRVIHGRRPLPPGHMECSPPRRLHLPLQPPPREVTPGVVPLAVLLCRGTLASLNRLRLHARWGKEEEVEEEEMEAVGKLAVGALHQSTLVAPGLARRRENQTRVSLDPRGSPHSLAEHHVHFRGARVWE